MRDGEDGHLYRETTDRFWVLRLITEVRDDGVHVRLAPIQRSFRQIKPDEIQEANVASYSATTYAGWHWGVHRTSGGNTVYRVRGTQGVEVRLPTGARWFIGSQRPRELESAITKLENTTE